MKLTRLLIIAIAGLSLQACGCGAQPTENDSQEMLYETAKDSEVSLTDRVRAAARLDQPMRTRLQNQLLGSLPGSWDVKTLNTILVIAEIGDNAAVPKLSELNRSRGAESGEIGAAIAVAIRKIGERSEKSQRARP